eukprot:TRINITY_DN8159_c0_g3_i3.p2 TRINITY_DN8159_c0_g3~~TRINITY_DN8159_c0_g3_i3.p2  ORF type:complete len:104 (-),score=24.47 TRINITY_DN8159_c0_g3_i3:91-402(-)
MQVTFSKEQKSTISNNKQEDRKQMPMLSTLVKIERSTETKELQDDKKESPIHFTFLKLEMFEIVFKEEQEVKKEKFRKVTFSKERRSTFSNNEHSARKQPPIF